MYAYLSLRTYNAKLFVIGEPVGTASRHVKIAANWVPFLARVQEGMIGPIDDAIEILKRARAALASGG